MQLGGKAELAGEEDVENPAVQTKPKKLDQDNQRKERTSRARVKLI